MAIAFDAATTAVGTDDLTFAHTVSGALRILIVSIGMRSDTGVGRNDIGSVTYGGVSMTRLDTQQKNALDVYLYYLVAPATGANNVIVDVNPRYAGCNIAAVAASYTGVNQVTPLGTQAKTGVTTTSMSVNVSSATGELVVDAAGKLNTDVLNVGADQTQRGQNGGGTGGAHARAAISDEAGAATTTMSWSWTNSVDAAVIAVPMKPGVAGGSGTMWWH